MRTIKGYGIEIKVRAQKYQYSDTKGIVIEANGVSLAIREDGTVHVMQAKSVTCYEQDNVTVHPG